MRAKEERLITAVSKCVHWDYHVQTRIRSLSAATAVLILMVAIQVFAQPKVTCDTQMVPTRDGTELYTEIYKPAEPGEYPVIIIRNPYGRLLGDGCFMGTGPSAAAWAESGYVGVLQEVRGTMRSEGVFTPFFQEQQD